MSVCGWIVCFIVFGLPLWCYMLMSGTFDWVFTLAENFPLVLDSMKNKFDGMTDKLAGLLAQAYGDHLRKTGQI